MYNLFWKLFPPYEVRLTIEQTISFLKDNSSSCMNLILPDAIALAKLAERTLYWIRIDRVHPYDLALVNILEVVEKYLASGNYHIHRGVLIAEGLDMMKLWVSAVEMLTARGFYSNAQSEQNVANINEIIKNAG